MIFIRIKHYLLKNIQSWDSNSTPINLSNDSMNVLIAPSETGKSVIVKIIKEMCFSGKWGYTWDSLIRRGCDFGAVAFVLEDDTIVTYHMWRNRVRYAIIYTDGRDNRIWEFNDKNHTEIPNEVADLMGLIIDRKGKTIINVLDKDMLTPYVTAPPELNARIASVITVVPDMEIRRDNLAVWKEQLESAYKNVDREYSSAYTAYVNAPEIDVLDYQLKLNNLENLLTVADPLERFYNWINTFTIPTELEEVLCPNIDSIINILDNIGGIIDVLSDIKDLKTPEPVVFDEHYLVTVLSYLEYINGISLAYNKVVTANKPSICIDEIGLENANNVLNLLSDLSNYGKSIKDLLSITKPREIKSPNKNIESIIAILKNISNVFYSLRDALCIEKPCYDLDIDSILYVEKIINILNLIDNLDIDNTLVFFTKLDEVTFNIVNIKSELEDLRKEMGICPTCGKPW